MRVLTGEETTTIYPEMFERVFGFKPDNQIPRMVMVPDSDFNGFISGYLIDMENFYMSWAGHSGGFKAARKMWADMEAELKGLGIKYFQARIENTDTATQRMLMGVGWVPFGCKMTQGKIFIEYYKEL